MIARVWASLMVAQCLGCGDLPDGTARLSFQPLDRVYVENWPGFPGDVGTQADLAPILFATDIDGDGDIDLIVHSGVFNDGHGIFSGVTGITIPGRPEYGAIQVGFVADLDNDGDPDFIARGGTDWFANDGTGSVQPIGNLGLGWNAVLVGAGDLDRDGNDELIVVGYLGNMAVLDYGESGLTGGGILSSGLGRPLSLSLGDLNGDGALDCVVTHARVSSSFDHDEEKISIFFGRGDRTFDPSVVMASGGYAASSAFLDLDGDGDLDVVVSNLFDQRVRLFRNDGGQFVESGTFGTGRGPVAMAVGDLDGDGHDDVVTADLGSDTLTVLFGDGESFSARGTYSASQGPNAIVMADLDGDGRLDLATVNTTAPDQYGFASGGEELHVLLRAH